MKLEILGYLESNTDETNLWVSVQDLYNDLNLDDSRNIEFEMAIVQLIDEQKVRFTQDSVGIIKLAMNYNIENTITNIKKSALVEMEEELQKCVNEEDYEGASEWRDMIDSFKEDNGED